MMKLVHAHPILTCKVAMDYEENFLEGDTDKTRRAMTKAGRRMGDAILRDFEELGPFPQNASILLLLGKGHNAGDAIIAADQILRHYPYASVCALFVLGSDDLRPLVAEAFENLQSVGKVNAYEQDDLDFFWGTRFDLCIDGIFGMQFKPPLWPEIGELLGIINDADNIRMRAAVDMPSGLGDQGIDEDAFRADYTYATGIAKTPLFSEGVIEHVGRIRYLDIGFWERPKFPSEARLLRPEVLLELQSFRPAQSDKRTYGHVFVLGGSFEMPGALLMSATAALKSGCGLLTAFVPSAMYPAFAAKLPEAMWLPYEVLESGGIDGASILEALGRLSKADALVLGPGMGNAETTQALLCDWVKKMECPLVLDADALHLPIMKALKDRPKSFGPVVLTPHLGEFRRISGHQGASVTDADLKAFCKEYQITLMLKGPVSRLTNGDQMIYSTLGSPVLARGGSGDVLSGVIAAQLAAGKEVMTAVSLALALQGEAASCLAQAKGATAVSASDCIPYFADAIRRQI